MNIPQGLKYTKNDEWIKVEDNTGLIGITDYAQEQLSDVVYVEIIVAQGEKVKKGDSCATVESVKAAADVYMPVSGAIISINDKELPETPELVNSDPFGKAWMVKVELSDSSELDDLMDADSYQKYCDEREQ